jgi:hypothetical protein
MSLVGDQAIAAAAVMAGGSVSAEQSQPATAPSAGNPQAEPREAVPELPVSVDRIKRQLARPPRSTDDPLRLQYYVEVYGKLPPIALFADGDDLHHGAVPFSGPTHKDILNQITPEEFRSPAADLTSLASLIASWLSGRKQGK